ncbi:hypothetical protein JQ620_15785 [Bradyrhizobium sp. AUGA SZCCT0274]|uniref:hypothetical protein n=1 Tax=Bradyrhizobium sp. AUGA SZCCT0274 TaxID=2807670 RepID=UPI001BAB64D7|nr:hypothetical protein [Bradyrhizobium sp. AUGA SZCCT0274]MBR1241590.1 hypothetical protein [Bradyrhizobium sp. AUGA SZCCT0274]
MSTHEKDVLQDCLFSRQDKKLFNIKFLRGNADVIAPEDFRAEICSIVAQRDTGLAPSGAVRTGKPQTDVRKLVADM